MIYDNETLSNCDGCRNIKCTCPKTIGSYTPPQDEDIKGGTCSKCGTFKGGDYGMNGDGVQSRHTCPPAMSAPEECQHDYENYIKKGRANLRCPKCDKDITMELVLMQEVLTPAPEEEIKLEDERIFTERYMEIVKKGNMDLMYDFGVEMGLLKARGEILLKADKRMVTHTQTHIIEVKCPECIKDDVAFQLHHN